MKTFGASYQGRIHRNVLASTWPAAWVSAVGLTLAIGLAWPTMARSADGADATASEAAKSSDVSTATKTDVLLTSGPIDSRLKPFDDLLQSFMAEHEVPGASLAIIHNGKLIADRAYGCANTERKEPVQPHSRFRIASLSKPITAVAVMQFVEQGKLKLDDRILEVLNIEPFVPDGTELDPRMREVTVRQCLQHTAGWDRGKTYDPMFAPRRISRALGVESPPSARDAVRYMLGQPLDFNPGEKYVYANIDYCILGRLIERLSGQLYEDYVQQKVFAPLGIESMQLGRTFPEECAECEVTYYGGDERSRAVFDPLRRRRVPTQYGGFCLEWMDAHGGWIATARDMARFAASFDKSPQTPLLKPKTIAMILERPDGSPGYTDDGRPAEMYYGCGWMVRPQGHGGGNLAHSGGLTGTSTLLVHRNDGLNIAVLFNSRYTKDKQELASAIMPKLHEAAAEVKEWD